MENKEFQTDYKNHVSNIKLKEGELFCRCCNQGVKKKNLVRHDRTIKHVKSATAFVGKINWK